MKHEQVDEALARLREITGRYRCLRQLDLDGLSPLDQTSFDDQIIAIADVEETPRITHGAPRRL